MVNKRAYIWEGITFITLMAVAILGLLLFYEDFKLNPLEAASLQNTTSVTTDSADNLYIVSDSNRVINKVSPDHELLYRLKGGTRAENGFYSVNDLTTDGLGNLYVQAAMWDETGSFLEIEKIMKYDPKGNYVETLFTLTDESQSKLIPVIKGLKYSQDKLEWSLLTEEGIELYTEGQEKSIGEISYSNAQIMVQDVERKDESHLLFMTKDGFVYEEDLRTSDRIIRYQPSPESIEKKSNIWGLQVARAGQIFINDLGQYGLFELKEGKLSLVLQRTDQFGQKDVIYYFHVNPDQMIAVNDQSIFIQTKGGNLEELGSLKVSQNIVFNRLLAWGSLLLLTASILLTFRWFYKYLIKKINLSQVGKTVPILLAVTVAAVLISMVAINYYSSIIETQAMNSLKMAVQNSKYIIDGRAVEAINNPTNYYNADYQLVSDQLQKLINYNQESWNENLYTALYDVEDGRYYALMYNDNGITPYYPFNAYEGDPDYDYFSRAISGEITEGTEVDADGQWIFSMGPIYGNNGEITAIIEVGMNKYIFDEWNDNIVKQIVIDIVSMIIILILLVSEITFFSSWLKERRNYRAAPETAEFNGLNVLRTLALLTYVIIFMCTAFIPVMAKSIYTPIGNLPMTLALGLPIFFEVLFTAITILFAGVLAEKKGWRLIFVLGTVILILSAIATGFTRSLPIFILVRSIAGIGNGFIQMTMYAFVNVGKSISGRNEAFAHMMSGAIAGTNLGIILGANLADKFGYFNVFFVMAFFGVIALLFERVFLRDYETMPYELSDEEAVEDHGNSSTEEPLHDHAKEELPWYRFFAKKDVAIYFILILVPAFLCYMYLEYFFPIFAEARGISTSVVGIVFSLYGLFIVYFGPTMSTYSERYLGAKNATALASVLTGLSLLAFGVTGNLAGAVVGVLILALSDSFGETVYTTYFLALKESQRIGKSIAAGYLEFVSQIGKMLGALAFGFAIGFGDQLGIGTIGLITLLMSIIFYLAYLKKSPE